MKPRFSPWNSNIQYAGMRLHSCTPHVMWIAVVFAVAVVLVVGVVFWSIVSVEVIIWGVLARITSR